MQHYRRRPLVSYEDDPIAKLERFAETRSARRESAVEPASPEDAHTGDSPQHQAVVDSDADAPSSVSEGESADDLVRMASEILRDDFSAGPSSGSRATGRQSPTDLAAFLQAARQIWSGVQQYLDRCDVAAVPDVLQGRAARGGLARLPVTVQNPTAEPLDLVLTATKFVNEAGVPLAANVNFDSPHAHVPAMGTEVVNALVRVPVDAVPGLYKGVLCTSGDDTLTLPVSLLVSDS